MKQSDKTEVYSTGKVDFILFPEVYFRFVSELHKNHDDILRAMVLAKVSLKDDSAFDFLNTFLGTNVNKSMPMEVGYAALLDALNMRVKNTLAATAIEKVAGQFQNHDMFPHRSDPSKPIFPDEPSQ
jgi:hypothetical protein